MAEADLCTPARGFTIGFTGLAGVARDLASGLARAGHGLVVHDDDLASAQQFARDFTCGIALDFAELAALGMLFFAPQAAAMHERIAAIAPKLHPGSIVVDLSDSDPTLTRELGALLSHRGVVLVDAPLCGDGRGAGTQAIVHGCDDESALEVALPVLRAMGREVLAGGTLGCGQAMRLLEAHMRASMLAAASEAMLAGDRIGLVGPSLRNRIEAATGHAFESGEVMRAGTAGQNFTAGLALGLFAQGRMSDLAVPARTPGLTRLLIEFTTPLNTKETF